MRCAKTHMSSLLTLVLSANTRRVIGRYSRHFLESTWNWATSRRSMSGRTYKDAIDCLNTLQSNAATLEAARLSGGRLAEFAMHETEEYLHRIGYMPHDLNKLNVIHIAGTKGKGSTCAFVDSALRHIMPQWNIGFYSSPHLVAVRERIRVNGKPISEEDFSDFFFYVWDKLERNTERKYSTTTLRPMYFRMLTLVAFHAFLTLKIDTVVLEVGVGGAYDCTNIVPKPVVTGVSALGFDHVAVLGKTMKEIAWQKSGIFKNGVPAMTVEQPEDAMDVMRGRARELQVSEFTVLTPTADFLHKKLGIAGLHQYQNANLAMHLIQKYFECRGIHIAADHFGNMLTKSFENTRWPGRCQTVVDPNFSNVTWFLDGAHTEESLKSCMQWFLGSRGSSSSSKILVFNCTSGRNAEAFLTSIVAEISTHLTTMSSNSKLSKFFDQVIFCSNVTYKDGGFKGDLSSRVIIESMDDTDPLKVQRELGKVWSSIIPAYPDEAVFVLPSIQHAYQAILREIGERSQIPNAEVDVLVAGSLHLVGGFIEVAGLAEVAL